MTEREIVTRLLHLEALEKRRGGNNALDRYNTGEKVHKKQLDFHKCVKRNRWVFGGNRSGKSECGAVEAVWLARGIHPFRENKPGVFGWVVSVSYEVQRDVAQAKVLNYLKPEWVEDVIMHNGSKSSPSYGIIDTLIIKNVFGGVSKIGFKSTEAGRDKFQGASLDFVWFDEEPPLDIYEECKMRVLDRKGDIFGTMTPLKGLTWVYDEIYLNKKQNPEVFYLTMEWGDNPFLDPGEVRLMTESMSESQLASRRYGRFFENTGLVYDEFDEYIHVIEPFDVPPEWQDNISIDPGLNNPLSAHFYCVDFDSNIYVVAEHYEKGRDVTYHANAIKAIADRLDWRRDRAGQLEAIIDSAAGQRTLASQKSVAELFFERGISVNTRVNKELFGGIAAVKEYFAARPPRIFIFKNCVNMIREIKSYWWGTGDTPVKKDDHAMDELRYYIMTRPSNSAKERSGKSMQQRHKEKLKRQNIPQIRI